MLLFLLLPKSYVQLGLIAESFEMYLDLIIKFSYLRVELLDALEQVRH
jgi:hypothetical protein